MKAEDYIYYGCFSGLWILRIQVSHTHTHTLKSLEKPPKQEGKVYSVYVAAPQTVDYAL